MSKVFWDTNLFIYLMEGGARSEQVATIRQRMLDRGDDLLTSALTLGEALVKPLETGDQELRRRYEHVIVAEAKVVPFDARAAVRFAEIRLDRSIRAPDAIQLACAATAEVELFITNDERLSRKNVRGIHFIQALDNATL